MHRLATAAEDAGFEIRDLFVWEHDGGQGKAFTQSHFVDRMPLKAAEKRRIIGELDGRKTPQLRPKFEPMILAQKPKDGTFVANWLKWQTGLVNLDFKGDKYQQTTVFNYAKPHKNKEFNHMTIKPVAMFERLIELFTTKGQTVLDPFLGSGTTAVAALETGRRIIGFEIEPQYFETTINRIKHLWKS